MRRDESTHIVVRTVGVTAALIVLGALPVLAAPTPTAEISPSSSPTSGPSADASPSIGATVRPSPSAGSSTATGPSEVASPGSTEGRASRDPRSKDPAGRAAPEERSFRQATPSASVSTVDDRFVPPSITVEVGSTVAWRNDGQNPHTITANDRAFDSGTLEPGRSFQVTFEEAGTVAYYCQIHGEPGSGMTGVVEVVAAADAPVEEPAEHPEGDGTVSTGPDALPRTGVSAGPLLLAVAMAIAGALALRVGSTRERR